MFPYFEIFGRDIGLYPLCALAGALLAGFFACRQAKKRGYDDNDMLVLLLWAGVGVLLGGHLLYGITNWELFLRALKTPAVFQSLPSFLNAAALVFGGSVFYGGLFGGMAAGFFYARLKKLSLPDFSDMAAPAAAIMHAFGRIGCFLGGCCYGVECPFGFVYTRAIYSAANGVRRFPVQLLEAVFELLLFAALWYLLEKGAFKGRLFCVYLAVYAVGRFLLEFLRGDEIRGFVLGLSTSQFISVIVFAAAVFYLFSSRPRKIKI